MNSVFGLVSTVDSFAVSLFACDGYLLVVFHQTWRIVFHLFIRSWNKFSLHSKVYLYKVVTLLALKFPNIFNNNPDWIHQATYQIYSAAYIISFQSAQYFSAHTFSPRVNRINVRRTSASFGWTINVSQLINVCECVLYCFHDCFHRIHK